MTYREPGDSEEASRVRKALVTAARARMAALRDVVRPGSYDHALVHRRPDMLDDVDLALLSRLCWHYRKRIPRHFAPSQNPDDPIVREQRCAA